MDGIKKIVAIFAIFMLVVTFASPVMAQMGGGRMAQPQAGGFQRGGQQAMPPQAGQGQQASMDLMATMEGRSDISMFTAAVKAAGYDRMLGRQAQAQGQYMVFAPTDQALQRDMGITDVNALVSDTKAVKDLVENCIVPEVKEPPQGSDTITMTTVGGAQLTATKTNAGITVNDIKISEVVMAANGVLAVTDGVVGTGGVQPTASPTIVPTASPAVMPTMMPGEMPGRMPGGMYRYQ